MAAAAPRGPAQEMTFEDVTIGFSREEWGLLDEAQGLLYYKVMLENLALEASLGHWHGSEAEEAPSEQSLSIEGESHVRASKAGLSTQKMSLCEMCILVLKDILPQAEHQTIYPLQKPALDGTHVRCFCFIAQQQSRGSGESPWKRDVNSASFVMSCSFYVSGEPFTCRELGENFLARLDLLRYQATPRSEEPHSDNESGQAFHRGKSHCKRGEYETPSSHNHTLVRHQSICYGGGFYECRKCGKVFSCNCSFVQHQQIPTGQRPYECGECGKSWSQISGLIKDCRIHSGTKPYGCRECGKLFAHNFSLIKHQRIHTGERTDECSDCGKVFIHKARLFPHRTQHMGGCIVSVVNVGSPSAANPASSKIREFTLERGLTSAMNVECPLDKVLAFSNTGEFTLGKGLMNAMYVENPLDKSLTSFDMRESTLEKCLMSAVNVGNLLAANLISLDTRGFTLEKSLKCAGNVLFLHSV
ncbi:zinc finger protein 551-like isoform X2 [Manis pentadactyla]|uniref:zinc finger protein 551-like isoform X2 n=1 Tax=Manis pentadactyla TaxID=143292 RepID=UPI00255CDE40|nr:zinc finger protein 551-like isoform X2 [Manis pentadactyla]